MDPGFWRRVSEALGLPVTSSRGVAGGDINLAFEARLGDGRRVFVKTHPDGPRTLFSCEARGLRWLREAGALRTPEVLAVADASGHQPGFLVLEYIEPAQRDPSFDETLARGLAALHKFGAPSFGLDYDNFIGSLPQPNGPRDNWCAFYREQRLEVQLRLAVDRGRIAESMARDFMRLFDRLEMLVGDPEPPSRLHGDLWGGNLHVDERGQPCLIDPAVYGGHREIDLAMMKLFGGFGRRVFEAYDEAWPLSDSSDRRVPLYQLYPLLVHVNLFGGSYVAQVSRALRAALD